MSRVLFIDSDEACCYDHFQWGRRKGLKGNTVVRPGRLFVSIVTAMAVFLVAIASVLVMAFSERDLNAGLFTGAVGVVALVAGAWALREVLRLSKSVRQVTEALDTLSRGEFGAQLPANPSGQIVDLVDAFNRMSRRMRESTEEAEESQREFRHAVARLGDTLAATHNLARILEVILQTAQLVLQSQRAVFFSVNPARTRIEARVVSGGEPGGALAPGSGLAGAVVARSRPLLYPGDAAPVPPEPVCSTAIAVPFFSQGVVFGVVALYGRSSDAEFSRDDFETLEALVRQAETAVDNVFLHEEAQRLSITDGLTGLWNRRQFELRCRQELERAARFDRSVGLIMCDIDHFKDLNDALGHLGGDAALVEISQRLTVATREIDTVARYGGEEFVLVLPETDLQGTTTLAEKIRRSIAEAPFEFDSGLHTVTASFGVASYPEMGATSRELVAAADAALYEAKHKGRNRVEVAPRVQRGSIEIDMTQSGPTTNFP